MSANRCEPDKTESYQEGVQARLDNMPKSSCPYKLNMYRSHLWYSGWNQTDIELIASKQAWSK